MPRRRLFSVLASTALAFALVVGTLAHPVTAAQARPALHVLFIGNSYTFVNSLPDVVAGIAGSLPKGPTIEPTMLATGGMTLQWHWAAGKAATAIDAQRWDTVVLQEQSALGAGTEVGDGRLSPPGLFHQSVRNFVPRIRTARSMPLLLMTWARRTHPDDQALLTRAYDDIGKELGVPVAPAGIAWQQAHVQWPSLDLFLADGSHPNPAGTYLTACVLYATLTGLTPRGASATIVGHPYSRERQGVDPDRQVTLVDLQPSLARRLQDLAWRVVTQRGLGKG